MSELRNEDWGSSESECNTEANYDTSSYERLDIRAGALNNNPNYHYETSNDDRKSATETIRDVC
jgi:hypothetical protein